MSRSPMPAKGLSREAVLQILRGARGDELDPARSRLTLLVPHAEEDVFDIGMDATRLFSRENAFFSKLMPSVAMVQNDVLDYALDLQRAPDGAGAAITAGGTESIFSACLAARDYARAHRRLTGSPQILASRSVHPAFHKAAHILHMEVVVTELDENLRAAPQLIEESITDNTVMIVGSAPAYPHGVFDPVADLAGLAEEHGIWFHVDACVGGYLSPFLERLGRPVPPYDFRLPGVWSMTADLHKHGYASKGISTVLYRDAALLGYQSFESSVWPLGTYRSPGFAGSRPAGPIAGAWAIMNYLGIEGYMRIADGIMHARDRLMEGITAIQGLRIWGAPESSVFAFGSHELDIFAVADRLKTRDWVPFKLREPKGLHMQCDPFEDRLVDAFLSDLRDSVDEVVGGAAPS